MSGSYNRQETNKKRVLLGIVIGLGICAVVGCFYGVKEYSAYNIKKRQAEAIEAVRQDSIQYAKEEMARKDAERLNTITDNSSSSSSTSNLVFLDAQYVIGYLLNQRFTNSTGIDIRFDGDGVIYVDGDAAGVISVLRYNATSALLRYSGGMYSEGEIRVRIENNRLVLIDPIDGTVLYQE